MYQKVHVVLYINVCRQDDIFYLMFDLNLPDRLLKAVMSWFKSFSSTSLLDTEVTRNGATIEDGTESYAN